MDANLPTIFFRNNGDISSPKTPTLRGVEYVKITSGVGVESLRISSSLLKVEDVSDES